LKTATLIGASGLVGSKLLKKLLKCDEFEEIILLNRKNITISHPKIKQFEIDFEDQSVFLDKIKGDIVFCCIGTTRKKTPNTSIYRNIDVGIPQKAIFAAEQNGIVQFHLISAIGADRNSKIIYNKIKGESEEVCFKSTVSSVHIYRPGLLIGKRKESRVGEWIFQKTSPLLDFFCRGKYAKYHSIKVSKLADFMLKIALIATKNQKTVYTYPFH